MSTLAGQSSVQPSTTQALPLIGGAFLVLAAYLMAQPAIVLVTGYHPRHSPLGIAWTAVTAAVTFALAVRKARTGLALGNPVLVTEGRVTPRGRHPGSGGPARPGPERGSGVWWADPVAAFVIVFYALRQAREIFSPRSLAGAAPFPGWLSHGHPSDRRRTIRGCSRCGGL